MTHVATLTCDPRGSVLGETTVARVRAALPAACEPRWLAPGIAADLFFTPDPGASDRVTPDALHPLCGADPVDVVVQKASHRRKKLLVADMDSTRVHR